ncbi:DUF6153 family protein [Microbacterium sp. KRD172]|nr:DUF6153 family protein [Microbacterium sp. KRD172]
MCSSSERGRVVDLAHRRQPGESGIGHVDPACKIGRRGPAPAISSAIQRRATSRQRTHGRTSRGRSGRRRKEKSAILCSDRRSSMHVERRGLHPQLSLRTALLLASAVLMIIVGLLGMHTFSSNAVGHGTAVGAHSSSAVDQATPIAGHTDAVAASATSAEPTVCDDACMTGSTGGRSNMLSACILALFAGLLLLLRPLFAQRLSPPLMVLMSRLRPEVEDTLSRAPSLTFLSISRT